MRYNPEKHRLPVCRVDGILLVDKPAEWTSFDVVNFVRSRFNVPKVGHCGTLDPAATGLLVLVLGKFTAYSSRFSGEDKTYLASVRLGVETDSGDMQGKIIAEKSTAGITNAACRETVLSFLGESMQLPPMVSAVKVGGKKLYELARKGVEVEREPRPITIHDIKINSCEVPDCEFEVKCSKGTYIRTLASDIGRKLGCGGVLTSLRRLQSGRFELKNAIALETLKNMDQTEFSGVVAGQLLALAGEKI